MHVTQNVTFLSLGHLLHVAVHEPNAPCCVAAARRFPLAQSCENRGEALRHASAAPGMRYGVGT